MSVIARFHQDPGTGERLTQIEQRPCTGTDAAGKPCTQDHYELEVLGERGRLGWKCPHKQVVISYSETTPVGHPTLQAACPKGCAMRLMTVAELDQLEEQGIA